MTRPIALPGTKRGRGNPNWDKPFQTIPVLVTEFEMQFERLRLTREQFVASVQLRLWCEHNRNRVYVPEWLLGEWGMTVESIFTGVARFSPGLLNKPVLNDLISDGLITKT